MTEEKFLEDFEEILQGEGELSLDDTLESHEEWDSMAKLTLMSYARKNCNKRISTKDIIQFKTIRDIYNTLWSE